MNKLKNIGITALAGTLVSLSAAEAGGVSVTGSWELSYTNLNHSKVTGNKLGVNKNITFGASGDLSDGGGVTWGSTVAASDSLGLSSASLAINMGGIATLAYDSGTGGYGANAVDNIVPTAWEEIDYGLSTGISDLGAVSATKGSVHFSVKAPGSGTGFSISYAPRMGTSHISDGATDGGTTTSGLRGVDATLDFVNYSAAHFGLRWGLSAQQIFAKQTCQVNDDAHNCNIHKGNPYGGSTFAKLAIGPLHLGLQGTFQDPQESADSGIANKRSIVAGAALVFQNLSFSYGEGWDRFKYNDASRGGDTGHGLGINLDDGNGNEFRSGGLNLDGSGGEYTETKFHGFSAAINMGPVAIKGTKNKVGGWGENGANTGEGLGKSHSEINLSIAF